ncbi:MAG TPA: hypothetical protein VKU19_01245 [Bryobacteraceae bacterium]|nr:hypothetical protein [Bryobacteraceae bacterium]
MASAILKVSVFSSGEVQLDGHPVTLPGLAQAMDAAPKGDALVCYYRENASGEAPPAATEVMKLIVDRRLPIRLSTKPDFSDAVTMKTATPLAGAFAAIRKRASERQLVVLRPDGRITSLPAMAKDAAPAKAIEAVERILPSSEARNVAVIGDTSWTMSPTPNLQEASRGIPFFGMLMGFAAIGHAVWIFEISTPAALAAACSEADLVIVDGDRLERLPSGWQNLVRSVMRTPQILVHDRATFQLRKVR